MEKRELGKEFKDAVNPLKLVQSMEQEEQRHVREGFFSDAEEPHYNMLLSENLSKQDIQKIKQIAVDLLQKVNARIAAFDHFLDQWPVTSS